MALLGSAVLAIWNGVADGFEDEFLNWHVHEHMADRVGMPGFLRARRYVALDGEPAYFNFYETVSVRDLASATYQCSLNNPSPWTREVVGHFVDTWRTVCDVSLSEGCGEGALVETLRLATRQPPEQFERELIGSVLEPAARTLGVVGTHLLRRHVDHSTARTAEMELRGAADQTADWIVLIEAVEQAPIRELRSGLLNDAALHRVGSTDIRRGLYALQFSLSRADSHLGRIGGHSAAHDVQGPVAGNEPNQEARS